LALSPSGKDGSGVRFGTRRTTLEQIEDSAEAEAKVLRDMQEIVVKFRRLSAQDVKDISGGVEQLREIRSSIYEDLNQIQHEYLLLRGLGWLLANGFDKVEKWEWNPRQTGSRNEPDLRGSANGEILISVEASTSEYPRGKVDSRMTETLEKLSKMEGQKFYFVSTVEMERRAETKTRKANWSIGVVRV
jgi:hypothetical protein